MSITEYRSIPYAYHSGNLTDAVAVRSCLSLASLFADDALPAKAVPFMKPLGTPLMVEGQVFQFTGLRLEVGKGEIGFQLELQRIGDRSVHASDRLIYLMPFPRYPLLTRLHAEHEPTCNLQRPSGTSTLLVHLLEAVERIHPLQGHHAAPMCLEAARHLQRMVKRGFPEGLSLTIGVMSLVVGKGLSIDTEETVYASPMARA